MRTIAIGDDKPTAELGTVSMSPELSPLVELEMKDEADVGGW